MVSIEMPLFPNAVRVPSTASKEYSLNTMQALKILLITILYNRLQCIYEIFDKASPKRL